MKFLNPTALDMMVKADAVTEHVMKMYFQIKDQVKARLAIDTFSLNCTYAMYGHHPIMSQY